MTRVPIVGGNWKMNGSLAVARDLTERVVTAHRDMATVEVVLFPPAVYLSTVLELTRGSTVEVGAQNIHEEKDGAFTGEICAAMLRDLGARWVILGHSERRHAPEGAESNTRVHRKLHAALKAGLSVILCVGETLDERQAGATEQVLQAQLESAFCDKHDAGSSAVVIAYEPVWAIGTGVTATPEQAQQAHAFIRGWFHKRYGSDLAERLRLQYGGSVKPGNAAELFALADVDGGLIGGASLNAEDFTAIVAAAASA